MKIFQKYVNEHTWIRMYGMLLEGFEPSYLDETPMLFIKLQERWGGVWAGGWRYFDGDNLGGAPTLSTSSWKTIFQPTPPLFGECRTMNISLVQNATIFGVLRNGGLSCLIRSIEILDPKVLMLWCVELQKPSEQLIQMSSPRWSTNFLPKWTRSSDKRENESHQTLKLQRVLLHANVPSAPPKLSPSKYLQPTLHLPLL